MPSYSFIDFPGISGIRGMNFSYNRGITPSVCTLYVVPSNNFDPGYGTLTYGDGNYDPMRINGMSVRACNLREHWDQKWPVWAVQLEDRRSQWRYGYIYGTYNDHLQGQAALISAASLMTLCLLAMGESGFDVSSAPLDVFPYVKWEATNPAAALADLCERCACEVVLNPLTDKVEIWPLGIGRESPTGLSETTPKYRFVPRANVPSVVEVQGGSSFFQYRLKLEAVGRGTNLVQSQSPDWLSGVNTSYEGFNFPNVTNTIGSELAMETGWRYYRVKSQESGGLNVPGLSFPITSTSQYVLQDFILYQAYDDRTGKYQLIDYYVEGDFWPYSDLPNNLTNAVYVGKSTLYKDRLLVKFDLPVVKLDSSGYIAEPTLYLQCAYKVKDTFGNEVGMLWQENVGSSGGKLVLKRPECIASYSALQNNQQQIATELAAYARRFKQKFANPQASELTYGGILPGTLDGNIAQFTHSIHPSRGPTTKVCEQEELDIYSPSRAERRRREQLAELYALHQKGPV